MEEMNDKEAIVNAFELYMDGLSNAYSGAWSEHLPNPAVLPPAGCR